MCNEKLKQMRPNESLNNTSSGVIDSKIENKLHTKYIAKKKNCFFGKRIK